MFGATMLTKKSSVIMLSRLSAYLQDPLGPAKKWLQLLHRDMENLDQYRCQPGVCNIILQCHWSVLYQY